MGGKSAKKHQVCFKALDFISQAMREHWKIVQRKVRGTHLSIMLKHLDFTCRRVPESDFKSTPRRSDWC